MKILNSILKCCATALITSLIVGCQEDESLMKPSALMAEPSLRFEAQGNEPQLLMVASDDDWMIDVPEDWITVDPVEGTQTVYVSVSVSDNIVDGVVSSPREGTITIADKSGYMVKTTIYQKGDNYLGVSEMKLSEVVALEDAAFAKVAEAQVVALASNGFIVTDKTGSIFVQSNVDVNLGDNVYLAGEKVTMYGGTVLKAGDVSVKSSGEVVRPAPIDFLSNLDPSNASEVLYVSLEAGLLGRDLYFDLPLPFPVSVSLLDPKNGDVDLDAANMHNIAIEGYYIGLEDGMITLVVTKIEDKGINSQLDSYFYEDFSWMKPLIEESGVLVEDSIEKNDPSGKAPNLKTTDGLKNLLDEFYARGYLDLNPDAKVIYPQLGYWKFSKTNEAPKNNNGGIILPPMDFEGSQLINVDMEFNWAAHMTGSGNIDKVSVVVELEGSGFFDNGTNVSDPFVTDQTKGNLKWQKAALMIKGVNNSTRITVRPKDFDKFEPSQQRWYIDNIKISASDIPYSDPVFANVVVSDEVVTFAGSPKSPSEIVIKSDHSWTLTKDMSSDWFTIDVTEGAAGEDVTVTITCDQSTSVDLRKGYFTISSADTRKNIYVVQSAAGGDLEPFISIVEGNSLNTACDEKTFTYSIQSNVEYVVNSDVDWITINPSTKALVEVNTFSFTVAKNTASESRTGHIIVSDTSNKFISVLLVTQEGFTSLHAEWLFSKDTMAEYADSFGSTKGIVDKTAGDGGLFVNSNVSGNGKITYVQVDKTELKALTDKNGKAYEPKRIVGSSGHPYVIGSWIGDYWLFTADSDASLPSGTKANISFITRTSKTGMKYWRLEYLDGGEWKPAMATATIEGTETAYNIMMHADGNTNVEIDATVTLTSASDKIQFRMLCVATDQANDDGPIDGINGGTCRIAGAAGTSPVIKVINE